jgi:hypothetical protein
VSVISNSFETLIHTLVSSEIAALFEPSIQAIIDAIEAICQAHEEISVSWKHLVCGHLYKNTLDSLSFLSVVLLQIIGSSLDCRNTLFLT